MLWGGLFSRQTRRIRVLLLLADLVLVWLAFEGAYAIRSALHLERMFYIDANVKALLILFSLLSWTLTGLWFEVHERVIHGSWLSTLRWTAQQSLVADLAVVLFQFSQRLNLSRPFLAFFFLLSVLFLSIFRLGFVWLAPRVFREWGAKRFVLIAGTGAGAARVAGLLENLSDYGFALAGFLGENEGQFTTGRRTYPVYARATAGEILRRQVIDEIIISPGEERLSDWEDLMLECDEEGVRTRLSVDFFPHVNSRVYLDRLEGLPLLTFAAAPHDEFRLVIKRTIDLSVALFALAVLAPLLLVIAVAIRLGSPGPAIFRQERCGLNGRRFTIYKFRTMEADAEERKQALAHMNIKRTAFKIPNDPRLTPIGRWLRKFSLDELPQLWNVVRGEMSLVGPRPPVPEEVEHYERWQRRRLRMRPGLTCLWALEGRDQLDFDDWMRWDLAYIDSWSLALDLRILLRTIPLVLLGRGAH